MKQCCAKMMQLTGCALALFSAACSSTKTVFLPDYKTQISFFENTAAYYPGNKLMKCKLSDTAMLNGFSCISWIWFFENGHLRQFETAAGIGMDAYTVPSGSVIFFSEQNSSKFDHIWFSKDVRIYNVECMGGRKISTTFYENDALKSCFLQGDQVIQGFSCQSSLLKPVYFYPDGKIKILSLGSDSTFGGVVFKRGESIVVGEDGSVARFKR